MHIFRIIVMSILVLLTVGVFLSSGDTAKFLVPAAHAQVCGYKSDGKYHCGTNCGYKSDGKYHCGTNCGYKSDGNYHCEGE